MPDPLLTYLQELQPDRVVLLDDGQRRCRVCHCTQDHACVDPVHGPCWWVEPDLCSHCGEPAIVAAELDRMTLPSVGATLVIKAPYGLAEMATWVLKARAALGRASITAPESFEP